MQYKILWLPMIDGSTASNAVFTNDSAKLKLTIQKIGSTKKGQQMDHQSKGILDLLPWSSNCCSKGTLLYSHKIPEAHKGISCNTSDRRTCMAYDTESCCTSSCTVMGILVILPKTSDINHSVSRFSHFFIKASFFFSFFFIELFN